MATPNRGSMGGGPRGPHQPMEKVKLKNAKGTLRRLINYMGNATLPLIIVFILSIITTVIGVVGTRLNGIAIDEISSIDTVSFFSESAQNAAAFSVLAGLAKICTIIIIIYVISAIGTYFTNRIMVRVAQGTTTRIRSDLFSSLQKLPLKYFDTHSSGDLMSRLTNDVDNINTTLSQSVAQLISGVIMILGMLVAMIIASPVLTLISVLTVPIMFLFTKFISKFTRRYFKSQQKELGALNGYVEEMVSGQKAVILFGREQHVKNEFSEINLRLQKSAMYSQAISGVMGPCMNMLNNITYLIVAAAGGYLIVKNVNALTVGTVFTFLMYMKNFSRPINEIANLFNTIQSALAGAERVFEVMDENKEQDAENALELTDCSGNIKADDVMFSYIEGKPVLKHASFDVKSGQTVAIVGPTGAGKTTIISLLTRFYDIDSGLITIDGTPIEQFQRDSLRRNIGMVLQDMFLFSESVMDNIRYGDVTASDEEVYEAAKLSGAHKFITQLENGYDTILSDNGQDLSQGQRQLLAIARVMLSKPKILILDEATSSIDTRTERDIQKALEHIMEGRTNFVIAHRLSTIKNADIIMVIDGGEIVERGTHSELLEKNGVYAELYNSQFRTGLAFD